MIQRSRTAALVVLLCLVSAGCGSRLSTESITATERGSTTGGAVSDASGVGQGTTGATTPEAATSGTGGAAVGSTGAAAPVTTGGSAPSSRPGGTATGTGATGTSTGSTGQQGAKAPIVLGNIGDYSGVAGASTGPGEQGILAWLAWTNAHGGLNGHKIILHSVDTGGDPAKAKGAAKDLVENRKVLAFVMAAQPFTFDSVRQYYQAKLVPVVGSDLTAASEFTTPVAYPQGTDPAILNQSLVKLLSLAGKSKLAILTCAEAAQCGQSGDTVEGAAPKYGMKVVYRANVSLAQPDFTNECLQAQRASADSMAVFLDSSGLIRVIQSCDRQGYHPQFIVNSGSTSAGTLSTKGAEGLITANQVFPFTITRTSSQQNYQAAMRKYSSPDQIGDPSSRSWAAGELFRVAALKAMASNHDTLTRAGLFAALDSLKNERADGTTPPLSFSPGEKGHSVRCFFTMRIVSARWASPDGDRPQCL